MGIRPESSASNQSESSGCCCSSCCCGSSTSRKPPCVRLKVKLLNLYVAKSECYGIFGEPGSSAEWKFTVTINGQPYTYSFDSVTDNSTQYFPGNQEIFVDLAASGSSTLTIGTGGKEIDDLSKDDDLPGAIVTYGSGTDYELNKTVLLSASSECFSYTLYFQVSCLSVQYSAIAKADYLTHVRTWLSNVGLPPIADDNLLLSAAATKVQAKRYSDMMSPCIDILWFQGPEPIQTSLDTVFPLVPTPPPPAPTPGFPPYQP